MNSREFLMSIIGALTMSIKGFRKLWQIKPPKCMQDSSQLQNTMLLSSYRCSKQLRRIPRISQEAFRRLRRIPRSPETHPRRHIGRLQNASEEASQNDTNTCKDKTSQDFLNRGRPDISNAWGFQTNLKRRGSFFLHLFFETLKAPKEPSRGTRKAPKDPQELPSASQELSGKAPSALEEASRKK